LTKLSGGLQNETLVLAMVGR